ncbi:uncharacterized protein G2W53_012560 [Senna tora]|uniref:Uncharacterized protein n=1 Tax=Senna tora TaxID=362788 RepID=A0A834WPV5_9FABA|nr:uncharacterized protein G2W53_012560 [Senna tora]
MLWTNKQGFAARFLADAVLSQLQFRFGQSATSPVSRRRLSSSK